MEQITVLAGKKRATQQALSCLRESLDVIENDPLTPKYYRITRNSAIQCFEFSVDTFWKFIKEYLLIIHSLSLSAPTPKSVFQEAFRANIITKEELGSFFIIVDNRNITSHSYNEDVAEEIVKQLSDNLNLMQSILDRTIVKEN